MEWVLPTVLPVQRSAGGKLVAPRSSAPHWCRQATWHRDKKSLCRWTWSCTRESVRCSGDFGFNAEVYPSQLEVTLVKSSFLLFAPYTKAVAANRQAQEETATTVNKREEFDLRSLLLASRDEDTETIPTLQSVSTFRAGPSDSDIHLRPAGGRPGSNIGSLATVCRL